MLHRLSTLDTGERQSRSACVGREEIGTVRGRCSERAMLDTITINVYC